LNGVRSTLLRWVLGEWLREIRDACGLTGAQVARQLGWAPFKLSRIENHQGVSPGDVRELLDAYGISHSDDVRPLVAMARQAQQRGWWQGYGDVLPSWFATFVGLEAGAAEERDYRGALVTGLLQTPDYARAVLAGDVRAGPPRAGAVPPGELERLLALRLERQQLLGEAADRALVQASAAPNITIQVLPDDRLHPTLDFPFCRLLFRDPRRMPGLVYLENFRKTLYLENGGDMEYYTAAFSGLTQATLSPAASRAVVLGHLTALDG
jgi:transcriptional regulator with XRE-family HTH domain